MNLKFSYKESKMSQRPKNKEYEKYANMERKIKGRGANYSDEGDWAITLGTPSNPIIEKGMLMLWKYICS